MFFSVFWTAYIPVCMVILSLAREWLMHSFRRLRVHAWIASSRADGGIVDLVAQCSLIIGCPARADPPSERERTRRQCCERFAQASIHGDPARLPPDHRGRNSGARVSTRGGRDGGANCSFAERARKAHDQRAALCPGPRSADHVARYFARASLVDRFEEGLRPGTVRRLHDHRQWTAHQ